jgi:hypothetical protein
MTMSKCCASILIAFTTLLSCSIPMSAVGQQTDAPKQKPQEIAAAEEAFAREDWPGAIEHFRAAIENGYDIPLIHMRLGFALHMLGKFEQAMPHHLRAAAALHPEVRVDGLYNAACAHARLGQVDQSLDYLAKAIDAGFLDAKQLEKDQDMDPLRQDDRFKKLTAGIGKNPVLHQWMDFLVGEWEQFGPEPDKQLVNSLTVSRSTEGSRTLSTVSRNIGGGQSTGMLWPDAQTRQWRWTTVDKTGAIMEFTGGRNDDGSIEFTGRERTAVGLGAHVRLKFQPQQDGSVLELTETSVDGQTWHVHQQAAYIRKKP